mmetsp:Transcript_26061/g.32821  ORF Transcript_26061/g.32821 Transcript_26061/m.32821 type:complete len:131 (+) Transcript_26061:715-1107(+)
MIRIRQSLLTCGQEIAVAGKIIQNSISPAYFFDLLHDHTSSSEASLLREACFSLFSPQQEKGCILIASAANFAHFLPQAQEEEEHGEHGELVEEDRPSDPSFVIGDVQLITTQHDDNDTNDKEEERTIKV